jgi:Flp pilus assembly protein TadG
MVEFALVGPLLLLVVFGAVDFGRAYFHENEITNAAREGARLAILRDHLCNTVNGTSTGTPACSSSSVSNETSVCQAIINEGQLVSANQWHCSENGTLPASGTGAANNAYVEIDQYVASGTSTTACDTTVSYSASTPRGNGYRSIKVRIDYYYRPVTPLISGLFPSSFHIESTACARAEY